MTKSQKTQMENLIYRGVILGQKMTENHPSAMNEEERKFREKLDFLSLEN